MKTLKIFAISTILLLQSPVAKAGWWDDFVDWALSPVRPVWGKYSEGGNTNRFPPLSTFDRGADVYLTQREKIRYNVIHSIASYDTIYAIIYNNAKNTSTASKCGDRGVCENAKIAKDAAFVYLMGFDENGDDLIGGIHDPGRQFFYDKASDVLQREDDWWGAFGGVDNQQYRAKELIELLQAHDYLHTAKGVGITTYPDYEDVRDALADFTYDLYGHGNNLFGSLDRYNNLTLLVPQSLASR